MKNFFLILLFYTSCQGIESEYNNFEQERFAHFIIKSKSIEFEKQLTLRGIGLNGLEQGYSNTGFRGFYDIAEIGDTLVKKKGTWIVEIHKKGGVFVFSTKM